jgi:hypothetical protein
LISEFVLPFFAVEEIVSVAINDDERDGEPLACPLYSIFSIGSIAGRVSLR